MPSGQYLVALPPFSRTAWILLGIDSAKFRRYWQSLIFRTQSLLISSSSSGTEVAWQSFSWFFIQAQQFSMGLRSGELPGQSISLMLGLCLNHSETILDLWPSRVNLRKPPPPPQRISCKSGLRHPIKMKFFLVHLNTHTCRKTQRAQRYSAGGGCYRYRYTRHFS